jgi:hypothetical protein
MTAAGLRMTTSPPSETAAAFPGMHRNRCSTNELQLSPQHDVSIRRVVAREQQVPPPAARTFGKTGWRCPAPVGGASAPTAPSGLVFNSRMAGQVLPQRPKHHSNAFNRYRASSACFGVSSSGSIAAQRIERRRTSNANRPNCCGLSGADAIVSTGAGSLRSCSSSSRGARAASRSRRSSAGRRVPRPAGRSCGSAGPSFTACMNTSVSPCSTASRCTLATPLPDLAGECGELEIVRGEQGVGAIRRREMHRAGVGQCEAVVGRGAAADFVHQHQRLCAVALMQDVSWSRSSRP